LTREKAQEDAVRTTSNPAFRNLPSAGPGYAQFNNYPGAQTAGYPGYDPYNAAPVKPDDRPMTIDDVVTKTAITLGLTVITAVITMFAGPGFTWLALPAAIVGFILSLVIIFKKMPNPALILSYAAVEGIFLGAITGVFDRIYPGIAIQAVIGTIGVFVGMLVVYRTGAIKVTPRLTKWIIGATFGAFVLMAVNMVAGFFVKGGLGIRSGGTLAIIVSLLFIGIAAFSFLLDFDAADQAIRSGTPAKYAWYIAFGLLVTLVWLYLEILQLLSYFAGND
jgi:uncharacterized YccA/Bax inhibitor family protein